MWSNGCGRCAGLLTLLLKTEKACPQAWHTRLVLVELVGGYVEYPAVGAKRNGPAPAPKPGCCPLTAPVPITSFSRPQHDAHMDEAPACTENKKLQKHTKTMIFNKSFSNLLACIKSRSITIHPSHDSIHNTNLMILYSWHFKQSHYTF